MTAYATLPEFVGQLEANSHAPVDDAWITGLLLDCSREFDQDTGFWFYAYTQTRAYDVPRRGRVLKLDAPLLSVTTLLNGTGTAIAASEYKLWPYNGPHKTEIRIIQSSNTIWESATAGDTEGVIEVTGTWGYVDRNATDPESLTPIATSKKAVLYLATALYRKRYGLGTTGATTVTGAGVVITPRDKSQEYWSLVHTLQAHL